LKALTGVRVVDAESYRENAYVLFDGAIAEVGPMEAFPGADEIYDARGKTVTPGLVLGHTHAYSALARGLTLRASPRNFREILETLWWRLDAALDRDAVRASALSYGLDLLKNGVTTLFDHHASGASIRGSLDTLSAALSRELGLRGVYCFETSDRFDVNACLEENLAFARGLREPRFEAGMLGLHASLTLSDASLALVSKGSEGIPVHIHVAEGPEDERDALARYGKRCVERLRDFGLLRENSILAHCVHTDARENSLIADSGAYVALNPLSNMNNAVGLPDWNAFKNAGVSCLPGNDGLGANFARDLFALPCAMRLAGKGPASFGDGDLKEIVDNAYALAGHLLGVRLGRIAPGYGADFVTMEYDPPTEMNEANAWAHYVSGMLDDFRPIDVVIGGEYKLRSSRPAADEAGIKSEARRAARAVRARFEA
jgi:cytosine/adenosine deaminase-related metal-dependent hydrolase